MIGLVLPVLLMAQDSAPEARPVIMQSLCTPTDPNSVYDPFGFELLFYSNSTYGAKVYPREGSSRPVPTIDLPKAAVRFMPSPNKGNMAIFLVDKAEVAGVSYTLTAISELVANKPEPFSVSITQRTEETGAGDWVPTVKAECTFLNAATPNERVPL